MTRRSKVETRRRTNKSLGQMILSSWLVGVERRVAMFLAMASLAVMGAWGQQSLSGAAEHPFAVAPDAGTIQTGVATPAGTATTSAVASSVPITADMALSSTQGIDYDAADAVYLLGELGVVRWTGAARVRDKVVDAETGKGGARPTAAPFSPLGAMSFISDVTVPDETVLAAGERFDKTWRVRNSGDVYWSEGYALEFVSGDRLGASESGFVPRVAAGEAADITVPMEAPSVPGSYAGHWRLVNAEGQAVVGGQLSVVILVPEPTATPTPSVDFTVIKQDVRPVIVDGGCNCEHNIYVTVIDAYGNPLDGLVVGDTYDNVELVTGDKGPGRCDFDLWGNSLELYVKRDTAGVPYRSEVTRRLSSSIPEIGDMINGGVCVDEAECQDKLERMSYCFGHYSYDVVFQRSW